MQSTNSFGLILWHVFGSSEVNIDATDEGNYFITKCVTVVLVCSLSCMWDFIQNAYRKSLLPSIWATITVIDPYGIKFFTAITFCNNLCKTQKQKNTLAACSRRDNDLCRYSTYFWRFNNNNASKRPRLQNVFWENKIIFVTNWGILTISAIVGRRLSKCRIQQD